LPGTRGPLDFAHLDDSIATRLVPGRSASSAPASPCSYGALGNVNHLELQQFIFATLLYLQAIQTIAAITCVKYLRILRTTVITPLPIGEQSNVMSVPVGMCVFVCPRSYLRNYTSDLHQFFERATYGRGPVLLWRRNDTLYTSSLIDNVCS